VAPAAELDVLDRRFAAHGVGPDVMELQEAALATAPLAFSDERAAPQVPNPDRTLDLGGDMA
jgi:hypothetical protein